MSEITHHLPGKRCIRTLTSLSNELNTKLQRHTISAQASGPCNELKDYTHILDMDQKWTTKFFIPLQTRSKPWTVFHPLDRRESLQGEKCWHSSRSPEEKENKITRFYTRNWFSCKAFQQENIKLVSSKLITVTRKLEHSNCKMKET